jgi:hypothetical protein
MVLATIMPAGKRFASQLRVSEPVFNASLRCEHFWSRE